MNKIITNSEKETFEFAKDLAQTLKGGETLCLVGDLGCGKTAFTKGLASGLGVEQIVTSPTFVLMKIYPINSDHINKIVHIDAYRLLNGSDLEAIGASDYINDKSCVTVIEWADRVYPVKLLDRYIKLNNQKDKFIKSITLEELEIFNRVKDIWPKNCLQINFKNLEGDNREIEVYPVKRPTV